MSEPSISAGTAVRALPAITVITPVRNGERFIAEALDSLWRQDYPRLQHLVCDACSTDKTLALLARYPRSEVISEPDGSAHEAMNKGLRRANGEVIGFLNVDDEYPDGVLDAVGHAFAADPALDALTGHSVVFEDAPAGRRTVVARTHPEANGWWLPELTFGVPGFNGCFFRRRVFDRIGLFDERYEFSGDRQFLMRIVLAGLRAVRIDRPSVNYRCHSGSRTINPELSHVMEISREYFGMAAEFMRRRDIAERDRRVFRAWHAFEGSKILLRSAARGETGEALRTAAALSRRDPLWPLWLARGLLYRRVVRRLDVS